MSRWHESTTSQDNFEPPTVRLMPLRLMDLSVIEFLATIVRADVNKTSTLRR